MITRAELEKHIVSKEICKLWEKTTVCILILDNWFEVVGTSACVDAIDFDISLWEKYAYEKAFDKLRELYWFLQHEQRTGNLPATKEVEGC